MKLTYKAPWNTGGRSWYGYLECEYDKRFAKVVLSWADDSDERVKERTKALDHLLQELGEDPVPSPHKLCAALQGGGHINVGVKWKQV